MGRSRLDDWNRRLVFRQTLNLSIERIATGKSMFAAHVKRRMSAFGKGEGLHWVDSAGSRCKKAVVGRVTAFGKSERQ